MKKRLFIAIALTLALFSTALIACKDKFTVGAPAKIQPGEQVQLTSSKKDATFEFIAGESFAVLTEGGLLTVNPDATIGETLKIVAKSGGNTSPAASIEIVHIKTTAISNAAATLPIVLAGQQTALTYTIEPQNTTEQVVWEITNGYSKASVMGSTLSVASDAPNGEIKLAAKVGNLTSNTVTVTVAKSVPLISVAISPAEAAITIGGHRFMTAALNPTNTTDNITWSITEGGDLATIDSETGKVSVSDDLDESDIGKKIKIQAAGAGKTSNTAVLTILEKSYRLTNRSSSDITIKNTDSAANPQIEFSVNDSKTGSQIQNLGEVFIKYDVAVGDGVISLDGTDVFSREVKQVKHGNARIAVYLMDSSDNIHDEDSISVTSIKTPWSILQPDYIVSSIALKGMTTFGEAKYPVYAVGKDQPFDYFAQINNINNPQSLNYGVCENVTYTFESLDDAGGLLASGSGVGVFENNKIKLLTTGKVRVTITSDSGNTPDKEFKTVQIFDVNEHQNVGNYEDLKIALTTGAGDTRGVNLVVTKKPVSFDSHVYNSYSIVPEFVQQGYTAANLAALKQLYTPTDSSVHNDWYYLEHIQIDIIDKNVEIHGNNHPIDFSHMRILNYPARRNLIRIQGSVEVGNDAKYLFASIGLTGATSLAPADLRPQFEDPAPIYTVRINDMRFFGNMTRDAVNIVENKSFPTTDDKLVKHGGHHLAVDIGHRNDRRANFEVQMDNIEVKNFAKGISVHRAINEVHPTFGTFQSKLSNIKVSELYEMGLSFAGTQIELHNIDFGFVGASPLELIYNFSAMCGIDEDKPQTVKITGNYNPGELNNGNSRYFQDFELKTGISLLPSVDFESLLNMSFAPLDESQLDHIKYTNDITGYETAYFFSAFALENPMHAMEIENSVNVDIISPALWDDGKNNAVWQLIFDKLIPASSGVEQKKENLGHNSSLLIFDNGDTVVGINDESLLDKDNPNTTDRIISFDSKLKYLSLNFSIGKLYMVNKYYDVPATDD